MVRVLSGHHVTVTIQELTGLNVVYFTALGAGIHQ